MLKTKLKDGKKFKIKHPVYNITMHFNVKTVNNELKPILEKISLPQKASKFEKLLLKMVKIYCNEVLITNLERGVQEELTSSPLHSNLLG